MPHVYHADMRCAACYHGRASHRAAFACQADRCPGLRSGRSIRAIEGSMKITDVEAMVLDTGKNYSDPSEAAEAHGVRFVSLIKITTDEGIVGWSDIETQPHVGKAIIDAPSSGAVGFESLRAALVGEDPLERERLWQKMYRYLAYYGRQGAGLQMISGADIALWDIAGKATGQSVSTLLGARYREKVKGYASTLFRPTPDGMREAV